MFEHAAMPVDAGDIAVGRLSRSGATSRASDASVSSARRPSRCAQMPRPDPDPTDGARLGDGVIIEALEDG
jgi:hypothetical protein